LKLLPKGFSKALEPKSQNNAQAQGHEKEGGGEEEGRRVGRVWEVDRTVSTKSGPTLEFTGGCQQRDISTLQVSRHSLVGFVDQPGPLEEIALLVHWSDQDTQALAHVAEMLHDRWMQIFHTSFGWLHWFTKGCRSSHSCLSRQGAWMRCDNKHIHPPVDFPVVDVAGVRSTRIIVYPWRMLLKLDRAV
jgi:hypothetical protein